jgi:hypothetical protein
MRLWMNQVHFDATYLSLFTDVHFIGKLREMTLDEETTLGAGQNYQHSFGSVQTSKLEMLLKMWKRYNSIRPELESKLAGQVCHLASVIGLI